MDGGSRPSLGMSIARAPLVKELVVVVVIWGERRWLMAIVGLGRPSTDPGGYKTEIESYVCQ